MLTITNKYCVSFRTKSTKQWGKHNLRTLTQIVLYAAMRILRYGMRVCLCVCGAPHLQVQLFHGAHCRLDEQIKVQLVQAGLGR